MIRGTRRATPAAARRRRSTAVLPFESLETRTFLSVTTADSAVAPVQWEGQEVLAKPGEWVLQLKNLGATAGKAVAKVNKLLARVDPSLQATADLGADGLLLLKGPADLGAAAVQRLAKKLPGFSFVEPNQVFSTQATMPNDPYTAGNQWDLSNTGQLIVQPGTPDADIDAPEAWDVTTGSPDTVVGVIDTGVDYTHPDLAANIWTNPGEVAGNGRDDDGNGYVDDVHGWDFVGATGARGDNDPTDVAGHGTHVAGTIAAVGNNGLAVTGITWNAKVMPLRIFDDAGHATEAGIVGAINYATTMRTRYGVNVRVTNNSWGGGDDSLAIDNAIRASGNAGILFVAAAGNDSSDNDAYGFYPANANAANVVSVAATDNTDSLARFSNFGATTVDLAAPGVDILSTSPGGQYAWMSGTSMAAPHVTGVAALAFGAAPNATYAQVRDALLQGGDAVASLAGLTATGRRLNAYGTLARLVKPTAAAGLTATAAQNGAGARVVQLRWTDTAKTESGYRVERSVNGGAFLPLATLGANAGAYDDAAVAAGATYRYRVTATGPAGDAAPAEAQVTLAAADPPPAVARLDVFGADWSAGFVAQLGGSTAAVVTAAAAGDTDLPWTTIDQVRVRFSENVTIQSGLLSVRGTNVPTYAVASFGYDPATFTATWKLSRPIGADRLRIDLPAVAVADAAGQPLPAPISQRLNVLPGDADRNGRVDAKDLMLIRAKTPSAAATGGAYSPWADLDGDGRVTAFDYAAARSKLASTLPAQSPAAAAATGFSAERIGSTDETVAGQLESSAVL